MKRIPLFAYLLIFCLQGKSQQLIDNASLFSNQEKSIIISRLQDVKDKSSVQMLIYTLKDLKGKPAGEYGLNLANKFHIGISGINNGLIVLIAKNDHTIQILAGYGLEWLLPDSLCQSFIDRMIPDFQNHQFSKGVLLAIDSIESRVASADWSLYDFKTDQLQNGRIYSKEYSDQRRNGLYRRVTESGPQFSDKYKITINLDGTDYYLSYSKYMTALLEKITKSHKVTLYFRIENLQSRQLQLSGAE
ncbi:MAG: TPM domain-containing protein [Bacteroidota bacterium]|nr:TPM domain-containing protein [Bacteroidota bacterium]